MNNLSKKWLIGDDPQHPVVAVSLLSADALTEGEQLEEGDVTGIAKLSPLLQALPSALTSHHVAQHNYMEVIIDGPLAKAKDGVGFRAFSLGDNGKIKEHAVLMDADKLSNLVNTGLLVQTASVLLAQKHLADINEKLIAISEDVKKIADFQSNERASKISAAIKYLRQVSSVLATGERLSAIRQKLEDFEVEFSSIQTHLRQDVISASYAIEHCADPDFFGTDGITREIKKHQQRMQKHIVEWKMALSVRICALQLASLFVENDALQAEREKSIKDDIEEFTQDLEKVERIQRQRIAGISSFTESSNATNANKVLLSKWLTLHLAPHREQMAQSHQLIEHFSQKLVIEQAQPTRLVVEMENGQPVKLFQAR